MRAMALLVLCVVSSGLFAAKDPTRPPGGSVTSATAGASGHSVDQALRLESVMMMSGRSVAVINGRRVGEGGRVGGARVVRIESDRVDIIIDNRRQRLYVHRPLTKNWKNRDRN